MTLLLIRHGETALNVSRVLQPADTPLSARGIAQAKAIARRLSTMNVQAILTSDLPRALRTAEAIAAVTGATIETTPLLRERDFGDWRGRPYDTLPIDPLTMAEAPPNGESSEAFEQRVVEAFAHAVALQGSVAKRSRGVTAVVTHGLVIRAMLASHVQFGEGMARPTHLGNTSLSLIGARPPHRVELLNCTAHLDATAGDDPQALSGG